jgi:hypothetical protein
MGEGGENPGTSWDGGAVWALAGAMEIGGQDGGSLPRKGAGPGTTVCGEVVDCSGHCCPGSSWRPWIRVSICVNRASMAGKKCSTTVVLSPPGQDDGGSASSSKDSRLDQSYLLFLLLWIFFSLCPETHMSFGDPGPGVFSCLEADVLVVCSHSAI